MPIAFTIVAGTIDKPQGWFDLPPVEGVSASAIQAKIKDRILAARDQLTLSLASDSKLQQDALTKLQGLAKKALIDTDEPPLNNESEIDEVLAILKTGSALSPGGWTIAYDDKLQRIMISPSPGPIAPTAEQIQLAADISRVAREMVSLFNAASLRDSKSWLAVVQPKSWAKLSYEEYMKLLLDIARIGLGDTYAQVAYARTAVAALETEVFILQGFAKRRWYLQRCAVYSAVATILSLIFYTDFVCTGLLGKLGSTACSNMQTSFLVFAGSMLGMWISIASGRVAMTLEELEQVINDPVGPGLRVLYVLTVAFAGIVLLKSGMVEFTVNKFKTEALGAGSDNPMGLLLIGILFGFSEKTLPTVFATRATEFVRGLGPKSS